MSVEEKLVTTEKVDKSRRLLNYSMSVFYILCSLFLIVFVISVLPALKSSRELIDQTIKAVKETRAAESRMTRSLQDFSIAMNPVLDSSGSFLTELTRTLEEYRAANALLVQKTKD